MAHVSGRQELSRSNGFHRVSDQDSIHHDLVASCKIRNRELMFGPNIRSKGVSSISILDHLALFKVGEGHENVVA